MERDDDTFSLEECLSNFSCIQGGDDVKNYLVKNAIVDEKRWVSKTYLFISDDLQKNILGYFTVSLKYIMVSDGLQLSKNSIKRLNPDSNSIAQCRLIGQLGRSTHAEKGFGTHILRYAIGMMRQFAKKEGCRTLRIDCANNKKLMEYYVKHGFRPISKNKDNDLIQMITMLDRGIDQIMDN